MTVQAGVMWIKRDGHYPDIWVCQDHSFGKSASFQHRKEQEGKLCRLCREVAWREVLAKQKIKITEEELDVVVSLCQFEKQVGCVDRNWFSAGSSVGNWASCPNDILLALKRLTRKGVTTGDKDTVYIRCEKPDYLTVKDRSPVGVIDDD